VQINSTTLPQLRELVSSLHSRVSSLIKDPSAVNKIENLHSDGIGEKCGIFAYMSHKPSVKIGQIFSAAMHISPMIGRM